SIESSRILTRAEVRRLRVIVRPQVLWTADVKAKRERQIEETSRRPLGKRVRGWLREIAGRDPIASEPLLRNYIGRRVLTETSRGDKPLFATGFLLSYDEEFIALADAKVPAETSLPLCPGRTTGAGIDVTWTADLLEIGNRLEDPLEILGIRAPEGFAPWPVRLKPGKRERKYFPKAPAGTVELLFETMVAGDVIASRDITRVRGGSEGAISILALPDLETTVGELPSSVESEEIAQEGGSTWQTSV
ncbi:MAG TPA: hypothetical protein VFR10_10015, partial [bacterium]|nr:hypothetical protein [bacterium]